MPDACDQLVGDCLPAPLTVAIQAGGESRRMGRSKATVPFMGGPLIQRVVSRVAPIADEILISTNEPENLGFLREHPAHDKIRLVRDIYDRRGSLTGLCTALHYATHDHIAVCACDMIFINHALFSREHDLLVADPTIAAVVPCDEVGLEPFHGVYRREACLPALREAIEAGTKSIRAFLASLSVRALDVESVKGIDPDMLCFVNANTPDELARAEELARSIEC